MSQDSKPSPPKAASDQQGLSTTAPAGVTQDKENASTAHLITFQPPQSLGDQPPVSRAALATATLLYEMHQRIRGRNWRWTRVLGALALACLVLLSGPGLYRGLKARRANSLALQGEVLIRNNKAEEAIPAIRSAFLLSPNAPEVLRALAQLLTALHASEAMTYWNWVLQTKGATDDDRRAAAECAMYSDSYNEASAIIRELLARDGRDARNELLAARWSTQRGTPDQTMHFATRAVNDDPTYQPAVLFLAVQELGNPYLHQDGINSLFQLAESNDGFGLMALHCLALDPNLKPDEIDHLIARLHAHPFAGESERIAALTFEIKRHPSQREALLDQAVAAHQKAAPADLASLAEWLNANGEAARVLKFIPRERALSDKNIFTAYVDALGVLNRWADLEALLSGATVPIEASMVELYLSRCAGEIGDNQASNLHWQNAVSAAAYSPAQSLHLAIYAEKLGQNERAAAVYRALTQEPVTARIAYLGLVRVLSDKDTRTLRDILEQMVLRWPKDREMASEDIFLNLLLNERVPEMHRRAVTILADDSNSISHHTNVALACLRLSDPAGALNAYSRIAIDWITAPVPDLVVYAATLDANGRTKAAHHLLISVNRHALRPELRDLIKSIP